MGQDDSRWRRPAPPLFQGKHTMEPDFGNLQFNANHATDMRAQTVGGGQKLVIYALLVNIAVVAAVVASLGRGPGVEPNLLLMLFILAGRIGGFLMGVYGLLQVARGLGWSTLAKVAMVIALLVPYVNVVLLLVVNSLATAFLRRSGYKVGLVGAYK